MISEEQQDQAALYALDSLDAAEAAAFERALEGNAELQTLVRELRDTAAALAFSRAPKIQPSPELKERILQEIGAQPKNVITPAPSAFRTWIPWAIAAALAIFSGVLLFDRSRVSERPVLVALAASEDGPANAQAVVAWNTQQQAGTIRITNLPAAARGKDYQLWAVDAAHKDPISAGIVRVEKTGATEVQFKPQEAARSVQAFAISLEREGGAPKKEGPILLVGKI